MNRPPGQGRRRTMPAAALPVAGGAAVAGAWWATTNFHLVDPFFLPSPADIAVAAARLPGYLVAQAWQTLAVTLAGFTIATAAGLAVAVTLASSRHVRAAVMPLLVAANSVPKVVVTPLLVAWLGFGHTPKIVLVVLMCFFPIVIATTTGLTRTPVELVELARVLCARPWATFVKIRLPWALPQMFVGIKVAITMAVIATVVAEMSNPEQGLGAVVFQAGTTADTPLAFAAIVGLVATSLGLYYAVVVTERLLLPWAQETTE